MKTKVVEEIERRFLMNDEPEDLANHPHNFIQQGYLTGRVRSTNGKEFILEVKVGKGKRRWELKVPLTREQFDLLWQETQKARLEKVRYRVPLAQRFAEVDVYLDDLFGHRQIEVEFPTLEESELFVPPAWFGREVTDDPRYGNHRLATHGVPHRKNKKRKKNG